MSQNLESYISSLPPAKRAGLTTEVIDRLAAIDPVIFARHKLDFWPDPWQETFLRSQSKRLILNCSRQSGKSATVAVLALWEALYKPRSVIVLDSPSLRQSQELMGKFSEFLALLNETVRLDSDTKLSARFANGSRVLALPGSEKTIRGISAVTLLILDEAAAIPDDLYVAVRPMLAVSGGRLALLSTPRGPQGFFWDVWENGGDEWDRFEVSAYDCPRISADFLEEEKRALGSAMFAQEYECKFIGEGITRVKREWLRYEDRPPADLDVIALGVDLAISEKASADWTAACVMGRDRKGDVHILEVQRVRTSFRQQQEFIKQLAEKWKPHVIGIEDVAYQRSMVEVMSASTTYRVVGVKPDRDKFARFAPLESRYELGQVWHARGLIPDFERELLSFGAEVDHDDMCDSMSIAWAALDMPRPDYSFSYSGGGVVSSGPGF